MRRNEYISKEIPKETEKILLFSDTYILKEEGKKVSTLSMYYAQHLPADSSSKDCFPPTSLQLT